MLTLLQNDILCVSAGRQLLVKLERLDGTRASTGLCVDVGSGVMI